MAASKKAQSKHHGQWTVVAREGHINLKTNRIGIFTIDATAPIVGGEADWQAGQATLTLEVGINEVTTGNRLLDPEVHALVNSGSDGVLTFAGTGHVTDSEVRFEGRAWAGNVEVPLVLTGAPQDLGGEERDVTIDGTATFEDIHLPLPGFSNVKQIDVHIQGLLKLMRA